MGTKQCSLIKKCIEPQVRHLPCQMSICPEAEGILTQMHLRRVCYSLVTVSVLVNIAALRHHGLFVQGERQFQLKQKHNACTEYNIIKLTNSIIWVLFSHIS